MWLARGRYCLACPIPRYGLPVKKPGRSFELLALEQVRRNQPFIHAQAPGQFIFLSGWTIIVINNPLKGSAYAFDYCFVPTLANLLHNRSAHYGRYLFASANNAYRLDSCDDLGSVRVEPV